jgi:hypothetical protein
MKKVIKGIACVSVLVPSLAFAANNPILNALSASDSGYEVMSAVEMKEARGAALIVGQPLPSVTHGIKKHHVTWKGFGSQADYQSYNYVGNSYSPDTSHSNGFSYNGGLYHVGGDQWLADTICVPQGQVLNFAFHSKKFKLGLFYWYRV